MTVSLNYLILIVPALLGVAFITLLERKVLSIVGARLGPNKTSIYGLFQPISDAVKLASKQVNSLSGFSATFYYMSSLLMLFSALMLWTIFFSVVDVKFGFLVIMISLGVNSLNSIIAGWSTFSKYPLLGSIRTVAQLISYEAVLYLCLFFIFLYCYTFNFFSSLGASTFFLSICSPICFYIWVPSVLAELNRTPYDFSEGESELVSGFNTDFGSSAFTLIFLAEYSNIIFFSLVTSLLFFTKFYPLFFFFFFFVIWIRSVLPRYRFDLLMSLAWKFFIPFLTLVFLSSVYFLSF
uniref:NADH-ubiquinone oxidoreductase chain 1 n=1 Tax=Phyllocoptes taishanensis TaxID=1638174 RepID=A0A0U2NKL0_9ACAR|nr:NADH dehydrogenase subunit 1 [Phyllocoptes taishanensis]ALK03807.1 NADH dehydrogenase subunit 1 [Phyllocoptes taishanensis]